MTYNHTQRAPLRLILVGAALLFVAAALLSPAPLVVRIATFAGALLVLFVAYCFGTLTVRDEGTHLAVLFGPIPVFRRRIAYTGMTEVRRARSRIIDGWGIHYTTSGWIFNLWGFDCVEIRSGSRTIRIGTDDPQGLAQFLGGKVRPKK